MRQSSYQLFPAVLPEEIAFAMSLFVNAANMRLSEGPSAQPAAFACSQHPDSISSSALSNPVACETHSGRPGESTLECAFGVLWRHYEGNSQRAPICARVLAFHNFMTGRNAGLLEHWLQPCPESLETVILDPAIVEAVASVALTKGGQFSESVFMARVQALAIISPAQEALAQ